MIKRSTRSLSIYPSVYLSISLFLFGSTALEDLSSFFSFLILYTVGRTPWTGDQPVATLLPTHRTTHTDIHALSGIRTHDPSIQAGEDGSCLRPRVHCDRPTGSLYPNKFSYI
jgi:hypothetical protein